MSLHARYRDLPSGVGRKQARRGGRGVLKGDLKGREGVSRLKVKEIRNRVTREWKRLRKTEKRQDKRGGES